MANCLCIIFFVYTPCIGNDRCLDAGVAIVWIFQVPFQLSGDGWGHETCRPVSFFVHFMIVGSESWFLMLALDLFASLRNPFVDTSKRVQRHHMLTWVGLDA